jgi:hypothetical protein
LQRRPKNLARFEQKQWIVDREGFVQKWNQARNCKQNAGKRQ